MTIVYLGAFIAGLLLGVGIMLFGIERRAAVGARAGAHALRISIPLVAAFAVGFGVAGYLISRVASPAVTFGAASAIGILSAVLIRWIVARSAAMVPEHDVEDERYILQGHIARVMTAIPAGADGEIMFEVSGARRTLKARGVDAVPVDAGTEVVIERVEGEVAYVEPWAYVERRL